MKLEEFKDSPSNVKMASFESAILAANAFDRHKLSNVDALKALIMTFVAVYFSLRSSFIEGIDDEVMRFIKTEIQRLDEIHSNEEEFDMQVLDELIEGLNKESSSNKKLS